MIAKIVPAVLAVALAAQAAVAQPSAWRSEAPRDLWYPNSAALVQLPDTDLFEVSATKLSIALADLRTQEFMELTPERARWYVGRHHSLSGGTRPYLRHRHRQSGRAPVLPAELTRWRDPRPRAAAARWPVRHLVFYRVLAERSAAQ